MAAKDRITIHVRITPELLKRIKLAAVSNERSMNSEVEGRLARSFSLDDADRDEALRLLADVASIIDRGRTPR
jgi:hypothetical protein